MTYIRKIQWPVYSHQECVPPDASKENPGTVWECGWCKAWWIIAIEKDGTYYWRECEL